MQQITAARPQSGAVTTETAEQSARLHGHYEIVLSLPVDGGFAINTFARTTGVRYDALCFTTADVDTANLAHRVIRDGAEQGVSPEGISQALTDALVTELAAMERRRDTPSINRIEHINRLLDRLDTAEDRALIADINRTLGRTIADTVPAGTKMQISPSRSGVERKPLSAPMQTALNSHIYGVIQVGNGILPVTLAALRRRGLGVLHYDGARKRVVSLELNKAGYNAVKAVAA
jgi:hypothetical protein